MTVVSINRFAVKSYHRFLTMSKAYVKMETNKRREMHKSEIKEFSAVYFPPRETDETEGKRNGQG